MRPSLRGYQADAVAAILKSFETHDSTLLVMCTGGGKTQVFSSVAEHFLGPGQRVLLLAHRKELVRQGADRLQLVTGEVVDVEMAEEWASNRARVVAASLDTIRGRLERWPPDHFSLIIFDECHHAVSPTYKKVLNHFTGKKLGVTATPDRGDEKALGQVWGDVAFVYDIVQGIEDGFLVPIRGRSVRIDEINLSSIGKTAGDLAAGELDDEMVRHVEGIVSKTLELEPHKRGIWFWPGVQSAELAALRISAAGQPCGFVCGETPKDERDEVFRAFREGRLQHISNCQIVTEGVDVPTCDMIALGRPTLSRALFAQICGRGGRVLPGVVDGLGTAEERRAAIAASDKPWMTLVDYCGNAGRHSLITPEDLLGGDYSEEEIKLAKKKAKEGADVDTLANLEAARRELKAMMAKLQSKVKARVTTFDPFGVLRMKPPESAQERFREPASADQLRMLNTTFNVKEERLKGLSKLEAQRLIGTLKTRRNLGLASLNQMAKLQEVLSEVPTNLTFSKASKAIQYLAEGCGWRPDASQKTILQGMVTR